MEAAAGDVLGATRRQRERADAGRRILCKRARLVMSELRDAEEEMSLWPTGGAGHVTIGALPVATLSLVPEALTLLAKPQIAQNTQADEHSS